MENYIALTSLQLRIYNFLRKCPIASYNKISWVCNCTKEGAIKVVKKLITAGLVDKIRRDIKGYDISNQYVVKTFKQALGKEDKFFSTEGLTPGLTDVHPLKESNNNVVVEDKQLIKELRNEVREATGSMVPNRFVSKIMLSPGYSLEYIREKIALAASATITQSVTGFLRRALEDDWQHPQPKEKENKPKSKKLSKSNPTEHVKNGNLGVHSSIKSAKPGELYRSMDGHIKRKPDYSSLYCN